MVTCTYEMLNAIANLVAADINDPFEFEYALHTLLLCDSIFKMHDRDDHMEALAFLSVSLIMTWLENDAGLMAVA